jgi:hypothetical protein
MADVRRARPSSAGRVDRSRVKKNGSSSTRKTRPREKVLATLDDVDINRLATIYSLCDQKQVELAALQNHYKLAMDEVREKYNLPKVPINIQFKTGKITEANENG